MTFLSILSFIIVIGLVGCAAEKKEMVNIVWPLPPDPPRVRYVKSIQDAKEVLPPKSFFKKAAAFLFGEAETPRVILPYGLFSGSAGKIFVTDTELQVVHLFDFSNKVYRQFFKIPGGGLKIPIGVAVDPEENVYISDSGLGRIFQFKAAGTFSKAWSANFTRPTGVAIDAQRKIFYVVDTAEHHVAAFNLKGEKLFEFGKRGTGEGEFNFPTHIAVSPVNGDVYVADSMNFRIEQFTSDGKFIRQIGSPGSQIGSFSKLKGIAVDSRGIIYAVDGLFDTVQMFNSKGEFLMNFGKAGNHEGEFWLPSGIAVYQDLIYVADSYNKRIQVFQLINASQSNGASE
ncbi:MAG: NHL repeat-containing protein [Nitrospiria bacterium]